MAAPTIDKFTKQFIEASKQEPGVVFKIVMTDAEATAAVKEYIEENREQMFPMILCQMKKIVYINIFQKMNYWMANNHPIFHSPNISLYLSFSFELI